MKKNVSDSDAMLRIGFFVIVLMAWAFELISGVLLIVFLILGSASLILSVC